MAHRLGEFEQLTLLALLQLKDEAYGVSVRAEIRKRTGRDVSLGTVYTTLARLESKGYLASEASEPRPERGGRRRRCYRLLPLGQEALRQSMDALRAMSHGLDREWEVS